MSHAPENGTPPHPPFIASLVRATLRQDVLVNLVFVLFMVVGALCVFSLPVERYPNVSMGKVVISAFLPGANPDEVEALVTRKIEDSLDDLKNVEYIRSRSYRERSSVLVKFLDDTDYQTQYDELRFKVLSIQNDLPENMDPPEFEIIDVSQWLPVVNVNLVGDRSNRALTLMSEEMKIPLRSIPGVQEVEVRGEFTREFHVALAPDRLVRFGVTFDDVAKALDNANVSIPAGDFQSREGEFVIVVDERFRTRDEVANTVVRRDKDGSFVTVGDVMSYAHVDYRDPVVISSVNGRDSVALKIVKSPEGNALDIVAAVEKVVQRFKPALEREGVRAVLNQDQRIYIDENISTLGSNLTLGIILVMLIIWLFMGFRNAMLTTVGVPFSFLVTMIIMRLTNNSLNEITLFSFVLVSGIIVDDAIVVVENIYRHVQEGKPIREAVVDGTAEVFLPVLAATSTTIAAFLPMLIMTGSTGEFFAQVPKAVSFALAASLVECLVILPPHFMDWPGARGLERRIRKAAQGGKTEERRFMLKLQRIADRFVVFGLRHPFLCLTTVFGGFVAAVAVLVVSIAGIAPLLNIKFFPNDYNLFYVELEGPPATSIDEVHSRLKSISDDLLAMGPHMVKNTQGLAGMAINEDYEEVFGANRGIINVELPAKADQSYADPVDFLEQLRAEVPKRYAEPGWILKVWPQKGGPPTGKDINVRVLGPDHRSVLALKNEIYDWMRANPKLSPWLVDLSTDTGTDNRIFRFTPRRDRIAEYGLTTRQVALLAGSVLDGRFVGEYRLADEDVDLRLKVDPKRLARPEDALTIPVLENSEGPVRLGDLCTVTSYREPGQLNRFQGLRAIAITANLKTGAPLSPPVVVHEVGRFYDSIKNKHPGATVSFAGEYESTGRSFTSLTYAFFIAVLLIYMILATQFHSYLQPVIILSAVPFALIGVIFGTLVTQSLFTVNSFIATVGVTGVVVNDSLVLLDFINKLYASGKSRHEAIREAVRIRLRPILLTTLTTTLGLLPMALGIPYYSLVWGTMATTFVTGLCTATALTIFIMPIEWNTVTAIQEWRDRRRSAQEARRA